MHDETSNDHLFPLFQCWETPFKSLSKSLRQVMRQRELHSHELATLAKLIYAIDRLPNPTDGVAIEAWTTKSHHHGQSSLILRHYGYSIELTYSEALYEQQGTERIDRCILEAEVGVGNNREVHDPLTVSIELEDWVNEWTNRICCRDSKFEVVDTGGNVNWNQPTPQHGWDALPPGV